MTATEEPFAGYLSHLAIRDNRLLINGNQDWALELPHNFTASILEDKVFEGCATFNIDYVGTDTVRNRVYEVMNNYEPQMAVQVQKQFSNSMKNTRRNNGSEAENDSAQNRSQVSKAQEALELARTRCSELFLDQHGSPYAAINVKGHIETLPMNSTRFRNWLSKIYYEQNKSVLNGEDITNALNVLKAEADFNENRHTLHLRLAEAPDTIYYDLTDSAWQAVKITAKGWSVENAPASLFMRYNNQQAQLRPSLMRDSGDVFERFFELTNIKTDENKLLLKNYIVALFWPDIPKPVLMLHGEQGSAKSTLQELIKDLVDPSSVKSLSFPRDINELVQKLSHHYVAYFDNISHIKEWISDELCKAVTGSGFSKRQLYTNDDDVIYNFMRAVGFNGINLGATKADLLDRGLIIQLERIPKGNRKKVKEIWSEFNAIKPQLLGYIFDTISKVLQSRKTSRVEMKELPRMADFAEIAEIISRCMGHPEGAFLAAYYRNIGLQTQEAIEANPIALCLSKFMANKSEWAGTASNLLTQLELMAVDLQMNTKFLEGWPKAPNALSRRLNEVSTNLRETGIVIERPTDTSSNTRLVQIRKISPESPEHPDSAKQARIDGGDTGGDSKPAEKTSPVVSPEQNQAQTGDTGNTGDVIHTSRGKQRYFMEIFRALLKGGDTVKRERLKQELVSSGQFDAGEAHQIIQDNLATNTIYEALPYEYREAQN
ncbi:MAG TPA: hypothetical protein VJP79_11735 [Nitrososphaera sp.]|nr:hypothetical protein [Nitrososphaera sp.]